MFLPAGYLDSLFLFNKVVKSRGKHRKLKYLL